MNSVNCWQGSGDNGGKTYGKGKKTIMLDEKIEKAQDAVEKAKVRYDAAVKELRVLLEKKDAQRKQELLKAVENSPRSFDEIMAFLKAEE